MCVHRSSMSGGQRQSAESEKRCGIGPQSHPAQRQPRKFTAQGVYVCMFVGKCGQCVQKMVLLLLLLLLMLYYRYLLTVSVQS